MTMETQMSQNVCPSNLWLLQPLTVLLLLASADSQTAPPKAVLKLEPPWINVLREDSVTLTCGGAHSPDSDSTQWFHNGNLIPTHTQPSYMFKANNNDSGEYRCQTGRTSLSDPVHLTVLSEWLALQTTHLEFREGETIMLRCHSWKDKPLIKVAFFQNGKSKNFSHMNPNFSIPQANHSHSGDYHCTGNIGYTPYSSKPVTITVQVPSVGSSSPMGIIVAVVTGIAVVAIVAAVVALIYCRKKRISANSTDPVKAARNEPLGRQTIALRKRQLEETNNDYETADGGYMTLNPRAPTDDRNIYMTLSPNDYDNSNN
ncbi:low affinity immunoglobulin gamma Fc region receptor II-a precursor [Macaca mulatta]|uniref:Low affinity immunoglobulin gamma Fc region receptor III-A n=1 Tax=Macaca mulatta TaxID=9544 RepID=H9BMP0_MACMU|nr:low affinity immunoglobulin gamma Fc region receptor II-a precursor [Macaca mulatta]AFD32561.1 FCGR2A [Macaca mulatta]QNL09520.1 Fc gamma receptor 2A [Macaca mulatta]